MDSTYSTHIVWIPTSAWRCSSWGLSAVTCNLCRDSPERVTQRLVQSTVSQMNRSLDYGGMYSQNGKYQVQYNYIQIPPQTRMRESSLAGPTFQKAQLFGSPGRSAHRAKLTKKTSENNPANLHEKWTVKHLHIICCLSGPCSRSAF